MRESDRRSYEASHAVGLRLHDGEEALPRRRIVARRAAQRVDEPRQRGKRRAQLMARIGHEVGAHFLDTAQRREIVEGEEHEARVETGAGYRGRDGFVPTVERHALKEFGALRSRARARVADCLQHLGHAQPERDRLARTQRRRKRGCPRVERDDIAAVVERDHGVRHCG